MKSTHLKTSDRLVEALRQYRHNNSDGFIAGYDIATIDRLVAGLERANADLRARLGAMPMLGIREVIAEMRARTVNHGRSTSATLETWAGRIEAALPKAAVCYAPTEEEIHQLQAGDYTPEELWGASTPSCPKCAPAPRPKARRTLLAQAESFGAYLTGEPDGSFPVTLVFPIESWRNFDAHLRPSATPQWLPIETVPKDGTVLRLLVDFEDNHLEDEEGPTHTIGCNNYNNDGEDAWKLAGWDWNYDRFTEGKGTPIGWLPMHASAPEQESLFALLVALGEKGVGVSGGTHGGPWEVRTPSSLQPELTVWEGTMPESNGKTNFTAVLMRRDAKGLEGFTKGYTIDVSEYPNRVRYEADRVRYLIGELDKAPDILEYDADKHSGYVPPAKEQP